MPYWRQSEGLNESVKQRSAIGSGRAFSLFDTDNLELFMTACYAWTDIINVEVVPLMETEEVMKLIASG